MPSSATLRTPIFLTSLLLLLLLQLQTANSQADSCAATCSDYNNILDGCLHDDDNDTDYNFCVCNADGFAPAIAECITCVGTDSSAYKFQQACKPVPKDCNVACSGFALVLQGCDSTSSTFTNCVCGGAYDLQYTQTFNEAFGDCVACEDGGGQAAGWEETCCKAGFGCIGLAASSTAAGGGGAAATSSPGSGGGAVETPTPTIVPIVPSPSPTPVVPNPTPDPTTNNGVRQMQGTTGVLVVVACVLKLLFW